MFRATVFRGQFADISTQSDGISRIRFTRADPARIAAALDCSVEHAGARRFAEQGTSATRQVTVYRNERAGGSSHDRTVRAVAEMLVAETVADL